MSMKKFGVKRFRAKELPSDIGEKLSIEMTLVHHGFDVERAGAQRYRFTPSVETPKSTWENREGLFMPTVKSVTHGLLKATKTNDEDLMAGKVVGFSEEAIDDYKLLQTSDGIEPRMRLKRLRQAITDPLHEGWLVAHGKNEVTFYPDSHKNALIVGVVALGTATLMTVAYEVRAHQQD